MVSLKKTKKKVILSGGESIFFFHLHMIIYFTPKANEFQKSSAANQNLYW